MAAKLQYVSELAGQTAREVTKNVDSWKRYLTTASRLYKYPFDEQLLIFAQRPDATACAEMELWNDKMRRWVRAGSKGIALIRQNGNGRPHLEYVFDIADTRPVRGAKTPWIWELREEHQETVLAALERQYGETAGTDFGSRLMELASRAAREIYQEHLDEFSYGVEGSFLEGLDSLNLEVRYRDTLTASVQYALLSRCGLDPSAYLEDGDLRGITEFSTPAVLYQLGGAVSSLSQNLLLEVGRAIKAYDREHAAAQKKIREKEEKPLAKTEAIRYTKDTEKFNILKREIKEGSEQNGRAGIQESGSLSDSRPDVRWRERDGGTAPGQVRDAAGYVPEREPQDDLYVLDASGDAASPSAGSRPEGAGRSGPDGSRNDEAGRRGRGTESPRPDGVGTEGERPDRAGRGSGTGRDRLQVNQEIQTAGEEPAVFLSSEPAYQQFSLFPTPEEQVEAIVRAEEREKVGSRVDRALSGAPEPVPKAVVGRALTSGGNRPRSLERIVAFFQKNPTGSAAASFLEKEFGVGGKGLRIGGKEYALWFDKEGLRIAPGKSARIPGSTLVSWVDAAAQVSLLLWEGKFASQEVIDRARDNEFQELSEKLWYLRQNFSDEAKERGFLPTISALYGGFPDSTANIKKELQGLPSRQAIVRELALFADEYEKDGELLRFRPASTPRELLEEVNNLFLPPERFTADPDFSPAKGNFITQDEIDHTLCRGSGVSEGKLRIYSYFVQGHDAKECAAFLREEYGDGGHSYTGYDEWHDSKGIKLSRADDFSHPRDYDTVKLNWNQVQKRIRELMDSGRYLNSRELAYLPEYEKIQLAREIYAFQYYNPNDTERTYPHEWDFSTAEKSIRPLLDDAEKSAALYRDMVKAMASVPTDHRHYQTMERALDKMAAFLRGEYSLFTPLPEAALQAERQEKREQKKETSPKAEKAPASDRRLEDAARALSKKQRRNIREQTDGQLSFDFAAMTLNHLEEQDAKEALKESEQVQENTQEEPIKEAEPEARYDLGYGHLGNGLTVRNRLEEENGDYKTIAHIAPNRTVTFYDQELPETVREQIQKIAVTSDLRISATQDAPVFSAPPDRPEQTKQWPGQTRPERNYRTFARMFPEIVSGEYRYLRLQAGESMMPLSIQRIAEDQIAVAHTHIQNGDVMNDPEMTFRLDREAGILEPLTFQQDGWPQIYQQVYPEPGRWIPKLSRDLSRFTEQWFKNIGEQGYCREQAIAERGGEDVTLRFDDEGNLLPEDAPASSVPPVKSPVTLYREALELLDREVKNSGLYSYLRDRDTDIDEAKDELDDALAHYIEEIGPENPELADAYLSLPMFREWLTEDLLERNYQDYSFDLRDSIDKNAGQPDTPEWAKEESRPPAVETAGRTDVSQRPETAPHGPLEPQNEGGEGMIPPQPEERIQDTGAGGSGELNRPQDVQPEPDLTPNAEEYLNLKAQHPDRLVGIQTGGYLLFYGKDAQEAAAALGTKVLTRNIPGLGETAVTGYSESWQAALKKLLEHGKSAVIARPDPEYGPNAPYEILKIRDAADYIPLGMELTMDGRRMKIDGVDYDRGTVSLQDMQMRGWFPIFREEPIPFVRSCVEEEQNREEQREIRADEMLRAAENAVQEEPAEGAQENPSYRLLSRLRSDCEYFLNEGQHEEKHLWAGSVEKQIAKMRELYQLLPEKPEWITEQDIDRYEQQMTGAIPEPELDKAAAPAPDNRVEIDGGSIALRSIVIDLTGQYKEEKEEPEQAQQSERLNFHITDEQLGVGGQKTKYQNNVAAIRTLKKIEEQGRLATPQEQETLSRYVGWGGLFQVFDETKENWKKEYAELKELLTPEEYESAKSTVLNAHYTSPTVIQAIYEAVGRMDFTPGNILEPSMGIGNFFGLVPEPFSDSRLYGVELDQLTGRIAKQLYQKADITIDGFENTSYPDDFFDLAVGNVPFGEYKVHDKRYDRQNLLIHDYFITKTLDKVRPGGIVAFITSKGTMDKQNSKVRAALAQKADLLGAIRLPNDAFKANAGTEVTIDILFFQKRDRAPEREPDWVQVGKTEDGVPLNRYYLDHPEMVLGKMSFFQNMYGNETETACLPEPGASLSEKLAEAVKHISQPDRELLLADAPGQENGQEVQSLPADPKVRNFSFTEVDGALYFRENSRMRPVDLGKTQTARVKGMIAVRDSARKLIELQLLGASDGEIKEEQAKLNRLYDSFTEKYGLLSSVGNRLAFRQDSSYPLLCSLEILDDEGNLARKADMFFKRTIQTHQAVTSVDTAAEALAVSIGEKACVDLAYMASLMGGSEKIPQIVEELKGVIYKDPDTGPFDLEADGDGWARGWQTADEYLSGDVREKLEKARAAAEQYPEFAVNVEALTQIQPKDLTAAEISVRVGASWIDPNYYRQFLFELLQTPYSLRGTKIDVFRSPVTGEWNVKGKSEDSKQNARVWATYGSKRRNAYLLFENALNQRDTRVYDTTYVDGKEVRTLNPKETAIAQQKQEAICEAFREWVFKDPQRRAELCAAYNKTFNSTRPREYDGSHIRFTGMNPEIKLEPHQRNAVARMLYGGNALLAHCVGAGKTFEMIAGAMEAKRLGLCQKSLFVVPNHLTEQWGGDFLTLYPGAKVLVATKRDFEPANRKKFCARIATGDYDAVIIGHSQFEKIPLSPARQEAAMKEQRDEIINAIAEAKAEKAERFTIKQLERTKKSLDTKIKRLYDKKRDDTITFEELGVDRLFVDEAHLFKNLYFHTKMQNVAGISQTEAQKSSDMFAKCRYLDEITGGRGVTFATGTPVSNSMVELYTMMRYLQLDMLKKRGMAHFDDWAANFGEKVTAVELKPEGTGFRAKTRFARFFNLPELMKLWKEAADIQTADMLKLPVPEVEYITVSTEPSEAQKQMVQDLAERAEAVRQGSVDPSVDNMLKITSDGRKLALDQRILNPLLGDDPNSKVNACVNNVFEIWKESAGTRGTQLIFSDLSTPKGKAERPPAKEGAEEPGDGNEQPEDAEALRLETSVYEDIRDKLVAKGIPREEIAFIHEANTEAQKAELFAKVRNGQIRVLLGSTQKMGAGTNVQKRLIASHDLDCPWRPADLEQRAGRILRRGNDNPKVKIFRYVTKGTFDAYNWGLVENKQKFIGQIMTSKSPARSIEDVDATALSYAEVKMIATGDPRIKEKMDLDIQVSKLKMLKSNHMAQKYEMEDKVVGYYPQKIAETRLFIEALSADLPILQSHPAKDDAFSITIQGKVYTERKEAGEALVAACQSIKDPEKPIELGEYRGFPMKLRFENRTFKVTMKQHLTYTAELSTDVVGNITRINNALEKIPENLVRNRERLENLQTELASTKEEAARPFPQEEELEQKSARLSQLNKELDNEEKQPKTEPAREEENEREAPGGKPSILKALKQFDRPAPAASGPAKEARREAVL